MSKKINTIVDPKDLMASGIRQSEADMAQVFIDIGLAASRLQAEYLAVVHAMDLGFRQYHAAMAVGRLAGPDLDPVDMASDDFVNLYNELANNTLRQMPAQGRA